MFDINSRIGNFRSRNRNKSQHPTFLLVGFDFVTIGNEDYILLTPPDYGQGEIHRFIQLPNDPRTMSELLEMLETSELNPDELFFPMGFRNCERGIPSTT
jgi:hypothetical protein